MRQRGKTNTRAADDEPVIQLTRGQMVLAVCALLIGALIFYLLGVVTSRFEPMLTSAHNQQGASQILPAPDAPGATRETPSSRRAQGEPEGTQTSPRQDIRPATQTPRAEMGTPETPQPTAENDNDGPPLMRIRAPEPETNTLRRPVVTSEAPAQTSDPGEQATPSGPRPVEFPAAAAAEDPGVTAEEPQEEPPRDTPTGAAAEAAGMPQDRRREESDTAALAPAAQIPTLDKIDLPPEQAAANSQGTSFFSIQLIAFSGRNRAKAEAYAKEVRESAGLDVELEVSPDGEFVRAFVGRYADRESALRACRELQKQQRFAQAFVPQTARGGVSRP